MATQVIDSMIHDGLWDAFNDYHMGITAENLVDKYQISREEQDAFPSAASQQKSRSCPEAAILMRKSPRSNVAQRKVDALQISKGRTTRAGTTAESLGRLRGAFKKDGSVTAGNASSLNDGAAAVMLMSADKAKALGCRCWQKSPPMPMRA